MWVLVRRYGTSQKELINGEWLSSGVLLYSGRDLGGPWKRKGQVFSADALQGHMPEGTQPPYM